MRTIRRLTIILFVMLTVAIVPAAQDKQAAYEDEMRNAELLIGRRAFENALQSYKKAYALKDKTSLDAALGMAMAYRGLGAYKNVFDVTTEAMKLAGDDPLLQAKVHNLRGTALVALATKPDDKKLTEAEVEFRAALQKNPELFSAQLNLGVTLLKLNRDDEGVRELKAYVERAPKGPETANTLKMIEEPRRARETYAPEFSFTSKQGEFITLEDLKGRVVVLDFWGTWCKPCLMATPSLLRLHKKYADDGVVFVGVAVRDQESDWAAYIDKNKMDWPQFLDTNRKIVMPYLVTGYPTYIVIDADGILRARKTGYGSDTDSWLEGEIKRALKRKQTNP
jgi:thiol-disulfide isomerase/thioredoxin